MWTCLRLNGVLFMLLTATVAGGVPVLAQAQDQPQQLQVVLGVVDFSGIMAESKAGKSLKAQADKRADDFEAEYKKQGKAFSDLEQKLEEQRPSLSREDYQKKVADLNAQGKKMRDALAGKKQALDGAFSKARDQLKKALIEIVADIAKKRGLTLVLNKNDTVLAAEGFDFSDEALKRLNEKLPSLKM